MKILHITADFVPKALWGMGPHVRFLTEQLNKDGIDTYIGTLNRFHNPERKTITTSKEIDLKYLSHNIHYLYDEIDKFLIWEKELAKEIIKQKTNPDIIHCHNWTS